jgi:hypothetical protein
MLDWAPMQTSVFIATRGPVVAACLGLLLACTVHADEIYKWVDKDGKTHYSSRPEDASGAPTRTMRAAAPPPSAGAPPSAQAANEEIIRRRSPAEGVDPQLSAPPAAPKRVVRNYRSEAPEDKCQLARDILSGDAKKTNGTAIDAKDREIAENDIRVYCGKK